MTEFVRALPRRPRHVLLTGVTGFVGQALLERFLREDAVVHAVVRPRGDESGEERLDALLGKSVFDTWREEVGPAGVARARARLHAVEADLGEGLPSLPADLDLVVHSASSVSFDEPWDHAIRANVLGPAHLYEALLASGGHPDVVHISTSYVGTDRVRHSLEAPVDHDVEWRSEVEAALTHRDRCESMRARRRLGGSTTSPDAEMRAAGRRRAGELGWTDVYTMTKALGERVAEDLWGAAGRRLTILRPTIIESALRRPLPGWIDGFKVADPLIAAFAKGRLVAFPGHPDAVLDIVPVDVVVDAAMAAAAIPAAEEGTRYLQVGTGVSNPITLDEFRCHVEQHVRANPWTDPQGRAVHPKPWRFLSPDGLDAWAGRRSTALRAASSLLRLVPVGPAVPARARAEASLRKLALLRDYVAIYQPYSCSHTVYDDANTRLLLDRTRGTDLEGALDVSEIDWQHYLSEVHMPSLARLAIEHRNRRTAQKTVAGADSGPTRRRNGITRQPAVRAGA